MAKMTPTKPAMALGSWAEGLQWGRVDGAVPGTVLLSSTSAMGSRPHFLLVQILVDTRGWWYPRRRERGSDPALPPLRPHHQSPQPG